MYIYRDHVLLLLLLLYFFFSKPSTKKTRTTKSLVIYTEKIHFIFSKAINRRFRMTSKRAQIKPQVIEMKRNLLFFQTQIEEIILFCILNINVLFTRILKFFSHSIIYRLLFSSFANTLKSTFHNFS